MQKSNMLQGEKIRLTAVSNDDVTTIASWYEDTVFSRMFDATPARPRSKDYWLNWLKQQEKGTDNFLFAIRPIDGNTLLGYVQLEDFLWPHQNCWLSIGLGDKTNWGKGYGREAIELTLKFAFYELNLHRIQLTVFSYNERAIALYESFGFKREGVFREHLQRDGHRYDMHLFGLLRHEWELTQEL